MKENYTNFYPTPKNLLRDITRNLQLWKYDGILEPSAGKGDICDFLKSKQEGLLIDCIEINPELQATLKGKGYAVIHNDFLTFKPRTHYDLIIMNPPFDNGAVHLRKALGMQKEGGRIICILNAETLKNPYSNERKLLVNELEKYQATISYREQEFSSAERATNVEIAVVDVIIPKKVNTSFIFSNLKEKYYKEESLSEVTDVADKDYLKSAVMQYDIEVEAGLMLIQEYKAMCPYILDSLNKNAEYSNPILTLKLGDKRDVSENEYVRRVRMKYWKALFEDERFTKAMTENMRSSYAEKVHELARYDFTIANIQEIQVQMCRNLIGGIEDCIMHLFDELSYQYAWSTEYNKNIHYYNGWASNKAWYVNTKVILPKQAWNYIWKRMEVGKYEFQGFFSDIEKALNYLDGCPGADIYIAECLKQADKIGKTKGIHCKYFDLTFYKKGTVHISFTNEDTIKKLNIYAGKKLNMLPPHYGKVRYEDMTPEEQKVVKEFDGSCEAYNKIFENKEQFLYEASENASLLTA